MGFAERIVRHPRTVIALWIAILVAVAPLALKLDEVLKYGETGFLPENTESVIADKILREKFNTSAQEFIASTLLVTGVDLSDPRVEELYREFVNRVDGVYGDIIVSYYSVKEDLENKSLDIALNLVKKIANTTLLVKNLTLELAETYGVLIDQVKELYNFTYTTRSLVVFYSSEYGILVENLTKLHNMIYIVRDTIKELDENYVLFKKNLSLTRILVDTIRRIVVDYNRLVYGLNKNYTLLYFNVTRTFYYLAYATNAFEEGRVDQEDVDRVLYYTNMSSLGPVDPWLVYKVFNITYSMSGGNKSLVDDLVLVNVTNKIFLSSLGGSKHYEIACSYTRQFHMVLSSNETPDNNLVLGAYTLDESTAGEKQDAVLRLIENLGLETVKLLVNPLAQTIYQEAVSQGYTIPYELALLMSREIVELGPDPSSEDLRKTVVEIAVEAVGAAGGATNVPREVLYRILYRIYDEGLTVDVLVDAYRDVVLVQAKQYPYPLNETIALCLDKVLALDPEATGDLAGDEELLKQLTITTVEEILDRMNVPENLHGIVEKIYDLGEEPSIGEVEELARELLVNTTLEHISSGKDLFKKYSVELNISGDVLREYIVLLIEKATRINASDEEQVYSATKDLVVGFINKTLKQSSPIQLPVDLEYLFNELYMLGANATEKELCSIAARVFRETVTVYMKGILGDKYVLYEKELNKTIEWVVANHPVDVEEAREFTISLVYGRVLDYATENPLVRDVLSAANLRELIEYFYSRSSYSNEVVASKAYSIAPVIKSVLEKYARAYIETLRSSDGTAFIVIFMPAGKDEDEMYMNALEIKKVAEEVFRKNYPGTKVYVAGGVITFKELSDTGRQDIDRVERYSTMLTVLMLLIVIGALFATIIPFISIGASLLLASALTYFIAIYVTDISSFARVLMIATALGLGIDYTAYYLHRFREYLEKGLGARDAAAEALRRAKDAILASASTDVIGFAALTIAWDFPFLRTIGVTVPVAIFTVFLASLTLVPAIASLIGGSRVFWWPKRIGRRGRAAGESRFARGVVKLRYLILVLVILLSIPATHAFLEFKGSHDIELYLPEGTQTREAYLALSREIGAETTSPTYVVLLFSKPVGDRELAVVEEISRRISSLEYVRVVYGPTRPFGEPLENISLTYVKAYNGTSFISSDNTTVMLKIILRVPSKSDEARETVVEIRRLLKEYIGRGDLAEAYTGGTAASLADLDYMLEESFWKKIIPLSVTLMFISLVLTLRGVLAALITMGTIYVGVTWSLWYSSILFSELFGKPLLWFLPLVILVVLLGVGVDYNSFYLVRARDEMEIHEPGKALCIATGSSGKLIIGLALILVSSYSSLMLTSTWALREMGFVLSTGTLFIAVSAVYFMAPAIASILGRKVWWPFKVGGRSSK